MDYSSDPIWVSEDDINENNVSFSNASVDEFNLPSSFLHSLEIYRVLWETVHWSKHITPSSEHHEFVGEDLVYKALTDLQLCLAIKLKETFPEKRIYVSSYNKSLVNCWELTEVF